MTINIRGLKESDSDQIVELAKSEHNESYYNFLTFSEAKIRALVKTTNCGKFLDFKIQKLT